MVEWLIENLFSFICSMSMEKIEELKKQYTNQHILYITAKQFVNTDGFKKEFPDVIPVINKDRILAISEEDIKPLKSVDELRSKLELVFDDMLITDNTSIKQSIIATIAAQYKAKQGLVVSLLDIIESQQEQTEEILSRIDDVDRKTLIIADSVQRKEALKEQAIKSGVGRKMEHLIQISCEGFISIVTKNPPTSTGLPTSLLKQYMDTIKKQIKDGFPCIGGNFYKKPISVIRPDPNGSLVPVNQEIETLHYLWQFRKQVRGYVDELLKYSSVLPDAFIISMISLENIVDSDINSYAIEWGVAKMFLNAIPTDPDGQVKSVKAYYKRLGEHILTMEEFLNLNYYNE